MGTVPSSSGYLPINGLNLYHEVYGELGGVEAAVAVDPRRVHGHRLDGGRGWTRSRASAP